MRTAYGVHEVGLLRKVEECDFNFHYLFRRTNERYEYTHTHI